MAEKKEIKVKKARIGSKMNEMKRPSGKHKMHEEKDQVA